ncbi:retropepsin-like aspartic protease [Ponticaulis profundi]|uniref:Retropepsin-like aspartic protease n=1 Tax=Ponticaulis profundi TaxID=2665222 RepID=A0ABW1S8A5_9PROT
MLYGFFRRGRAGYLYDPPCLAGKVEITLNAGEPPLSGCVTFLVDTGAQHTILNPVDARRLGWTFSSDVPNVLVQGIAGEALAQEVEASVFFADPDEAVLRGFSVSLLILPYEERLLKRPSVIGRDLLHFWDMSHGPYQGVLEFEPVWKGEVRAYEAVIEDRHPR